MKNEDILKSIQENRLDNVPDEMEQLQILRSTRILTLSFCAMMTLTFVLNLFCKNNVGVAENAGLIFIVTGVADYYFDKKQKNKFRKTLDVIGIIIGLLFYIIFILALVGKR